jgi:hypothetical protein
MPIPSREEVVAWSPAERAQMAKVLDELLDRSDLNAGLARRRLLILTLVALGGVLLLPWVGYLAISLPDASRAEAWKTAWVGFDLILAAVLMLTAWLGFHRRLLTTLGMIVAATMLLVDAWFDLTLSFRTDEWGASIVTSFLEIPFAILLLISARAILRRSMTTVARLRGSPTTRVPLWREPMVGTDHPEDPF